MSFSISIFRSGSLRDPKGPDNPGVLAGKALIDTVTSVNSGGDIVVEIKNAFEARHGAGSVALSNTPMGYEWVWDEEQQIWTLRCKTNSQLLVDDGEAKALVVNITVFA